MPFYERPTNAHRTPPEVINAEWGKEVSTRDSTSMTVILEIEGHSLSQEVIDWVLVTFFMRGPFSTSLPNPFIEYDGRKPRYLEKKLRSNGSRSHFQITYPVESH